MDVMSFRVRLIQKKRKKRKQNRISFRFHVLPSSARNMEIFYTAVRTGDVSKVIEILKSNPTVDVNQDPFLVTDGFMFSYMMMPPPLFTVSDAIVSILLAHPDIKVNETCDVMTVALR